MGFTPYGRRMMLGAYFGLSPAMTTSWLALTPTIPTTNPSTEFLVEPVAPEYKRVQYSMGAGFWTFQGWSELGNAVPIKFPTPASDWGMLRGWALCNGSGPSDVIASGALRQPRRASQGTSLLIAIGALRLSLR